MSQIEKWGVFETAVNGKNDARDKAGCFLGKEEEETAEKLGRLATTVHGRSAKDLTRSRSRSSVGIEEKRSVLI